MSGHEFTDQGHLRARYTDRLVVLDTEPRKGTP